MSEKKTTEDYLRESIKLLKDRKSRKAFIFKISAVAVLSPFAAFGIYEYSIANGSFVPDEPSGRVYAMNYKGRNLYITKTQYALIVTLPFAGIAVYGLANLITSPKLGLFTFESEE